MKYGTWNFGQVEALLNKLGENNALRILACSEVVVDFKEGHAGVTGLQHVIDCDAAPFVPDGWKVEEHKQGGQFTWDPAQLKFYLSKHQTGDKSIEGNKLRKELANEPTLNACLLDYLLDHPHLIPEAWKTDENGNTRYTFFWSTVYRDSDGYLCVRCLCFGGGRWRWGYFWLGLGFYSNDPALLRAS